MAMPAPHRCTVDRSHQMARDGVGPGARLHGRSVTAAGGRAVAGAQRSMVLLPYSEPQADLAVRAARPDRRASGDAGSMEVLLRVEVVDSTLPFHRRRRLPLHGRHGVVEVAGPLPRA